MELMRDESEGHGVEGDGNGGKEGF